MGWVDFMLLWIPIYNLHLRLNLVVFAFENDLSHNLVSAFHVLDDEAFDASLSFYVDQ